MVKFGLVDVPETQDGEVGHVGEVGQGHKHIVLCPQYDQVKVS